MDTIKSQYAEFGYVIVPNIIPNEQLGEVERSIVNETFQILYRDIPADRRPPIDLNILTDPEMRRTWHLPNTAIWRNGNSRQPIWSKNSGMINICYNPMVQKYIRYHPGIFNIIAALYGHSQIAYTKGPERVCLKPKGATDMPKHLDHHLFNALVNDEVNRVQAFVNISVPEDVPIKDSGTIQVIPHFHLYWPFAQRFFHKRIEAFDVIPLLLPANFDHELDNFNFLLQELHSLVQNGKTYGWVSMVEITKYLDLLHVLPSKYYALKWQVIKLQKGDLFCFDHRLPHANLRNRSLIPRIVAYVSYFEYTADWLTSAARVALQAMVSSGRAGQNGGTNRDNDHERTVLRAADYSYIYNPTEFDATYFSCLEDYQRWCWQIQGF